ncbi:MAG: response regulator [Campylobacterales bacterium]|nr:response regulator [Campylobacterales bacterium]
MNVTNVLVIDDSKLITKIITKALLSNNIKNHFFSENNIFISYDGMEAFEMLSKHPEITLIISDVMMPNLNGDELVEMLIDIGKIHLLEIIFVTTENNANYLKSTIKDNIKGIIYKPFNNNTFCESYNELEVRHFKKNEQNKKIKLTHKKQIKHIKIWSQTYFTKKDLTISENLFEKIINAEFDHFSKIDNDELFMLLHAIVDNYISEKFEGHILDIELLKEIYHFWNNSDEHSELGLKQILNTIIAEAKDSLNNNSTKEEVRFAILQPIHRLISNVYNKSKSKQALPYEDFIPYFPTLIEKLYKIDNNIELKHVKLILSHINEINAARDMIFTLSDTSEVIEIFPFLDKNSNNYEEMIFTITQYFRMFINTLDRQVIPRYVHEINTALWVSIKKSSAIKIYIKQKLQFTTPNTHNVLAHFGQLTTIEKGKYKKYDKTTVYVLTKQIDASKLFQDTLLKNLPSWEIVIFSKYSLLKSNLDHRIVDKLIVDLSFVDNIFNNVLQLINSLRKHFKSIDTLIENNGLYILASLDQVELLHHNKDNLKYNIILSPLNEKNIYDKIFWNC